MTSIDSNKVTDVEVQNQNDSSTSEVIPTNNDQNPNTSTIENVDEVTMFTSEIATSNKALYSFCKENSIVNTLSIDDMGNIEIQAELENNTYGITLLPLDAEPVFDKLVEELNSLEEEQPKNKPNVGDLICGQKMNEDWVRGYIVSQLPYLKMAVVDEAIVAIINNIAPCDKVSSDICAFGALCEVTDPGHKFEVSDLCEYIVTGHSQGGYEVLLFIDGHEVKATFKPWVPTPEQIGVSYAEVNNETEVIVTGYRNHIFLYVRPVDAIGTARYNFIMETVAKVAQNSPFIENVDIARSAIALAPDGNYYRGYITRVEKDRVQMMYHDLGRREYVDRKTLKVYPEFLKKLGYPISKVYLRDVPKNIPPFRPIVEILDRLVESQVHLVCSFDGMAAIEGVYLKHPDGETVNRMICKTLEPPVPKGASE